MAGGPSSALGMGVFLALLGALAFSFMNVFVRKGVGSGGTDNGVLTSMLVNVVIFTLLLLGVVIAVGIDAWSTVALIWFAIAGLSATFLGRQMLFGAIRHLGAARATAIKNATPLVTLAIALTFIGERLTPLATAGIALILIGLFALFHDSITGESQSRHGGIPYPVEAAFEAEVAAAAGLRGRARELAGRTVAKVGAASRRATLSGVVLASLAAVFFGSGHAFRKIGMDLWPDALIGATVGTWTGTLAYLAMAAVRGQFRSVVMSTLGIFRPYFVAAGAAGTVGQLSFFAALAFAPVSYVSVVAASETVLTIVLTALLARRVESITRRVAVLSLAVFGGATLIAIGG